MKKLDCSTCLKSCRSCCFVIPVCRFQWCLIFFLRVALVFIYATSYICDDTTRVLLLSSLLIDKPKLGSEATNRFVYRKPLSGLGFPLGFSFTGFWILHLKIYQPLFWEMAISKPLSFNLLRCSVCFDFTFHLSRTLSLVSRDLSRFCSHAFLFNL